ncbi:MAG: DinB family protein [Planctomycetota bacterium]|jgi:uncharacterized damage-inducible protein DinB
MFTDLLEEALDAWTDAREGVIEEVENIPPDHFDFRPIPEVRSVAEMLRHILEVSLMMAGELTREDTDFRRLPWPRLLATYAGGVQHLEAKEELLAALRGTLARDRERFQTVGELHMLQLIARFDGQLGTRLAWLHHGIAQEMYHRGQLTMYARLMGLEPALTRKIRGA